MSHKKKVPLETLNKIEPLSIKSTHFSNTHYFMFLGLYLIKNYLYNIYFLGGLYCVKFVK